MSDVFLSIWGVHFGKHFPDATQSPGIYARKINGGYSEGPGSENNLFSIYTAFD